MITFVAVCLNNDQKKVCRSLGIEVVQNYANSYGEITMNCITNYSIHCFNSGALQVLKTLGVQRATLHPELNLAQIRDITKPIDTEAVIYGKLPLMKLGEPQVNGIITDRKNTAFYVAGDTLYNSVPIFIADKLTTVEKSGISHGRLIFTTESPEEVKTVIYAYRHQKMIDIAFTRGKFFSKVE